MISEITLYLNTRDHRLEAYLNIEGDFVRGLKLVGVYIMKGGFIIQVIII